MKRITLPREHGGPLTLLGATAASALLAPSPAAALGVELMLLVAFLARGPLERKATARPWDHAALAVMAVLGVLGLYLASRGRIAGAALAAAGALALPGGALLARRRHWLHGAGFELVAMLGLGASAGLAAWCGDLAEPRALVLGILLGAHAAASVPLVRAQVRRRERPQVLLAGFLVAAGAVGVFCISGVLALVVLLPRSLDIALATGRVAGRVDPRSVGLRESALLTAAAVLAVVTV